MPTIQELEANIARLQLENQQLQERVQTLERDIRRAKDSSPVGRPSLKRVLDAIRGPGFDLIKKNRQWILKFGSLERTFRRLRDIWEAVTSDFYLSDLFQTAAKHTKPKTLLAASNPAKRLPFQYICVPFEGDEIDFSGVAEWERPPAR